MLDYTSLAFFAAAILMLFVSWTDIKSYRIPDLPVLGIGILGLLTRYLQCDDLAQAIIVALIVGFFMFVLAILFEKIRMQPVLGYGDVKLFTASVLWLQFSQVPAFFIITGVCGILFALLYGKKKYFPLAPSIVIAWLLTLL